MSRWDKKTEGRPRSRREDFSSQTRSRSRSRSNSPIEQRLRVLDEERRLKEKELREAVHPPQIDSSSSGDSSDGSCPEEIPPAPVATSKIGFGFKKPTADITKSKSTAILQMQKSKPTAIQMSLKTVPNKETPKLLKPIANAFAADDSDDEPEEMPAECRMRMRNIGRETPTSSGPNSFGKTKHGFCDSKKMFEKKMNSLNDG
ncbi:PEST proteolytic signal-containing nuclear protein-like [Topomyia yanbarensis]|uniref:PEST proteolytic signal-containing nuclear protein-like n=1 Tax=Topomyia yanbarensis TaxID=2498891 RepID=UPI00273CE640|nr:PEST proteolytic signal-containing nuclear protein-like [Topomyia yanbarensis]